jgi:alkaline phosphatase D
LFEDYSNKLSALLGAFSTERFRVNAGERELYRDFDGQWKRWDRTSLSWV